MRDLKAVSDSEESVLHKSELSESEMDLEEDKIRLLKQQARKIAEDETQYPESGSEYQEAVPSEDSETKLNKMKKKYEHLRIKSQMSSRGNKTVTSMMSNESKKNDEYVAELQADIERKERPGSV